MDKSLGSWSADTVQRGTGFPLFKQNETAGTGSGVFTLHPEDHHLTVGASDSTKDITQEDYSSYSKREEAQPLSIDGRADSINTLPDSYGIENQGKNKYKP